MSYTHDRSIGTRGVGAVAANDLREGRGGAVVRTGRGPVTIVRKPASLGALAFKKVVAKKTAWGKQPKLIPKRSVSTMGKQILTARAVASSPLMIHPGVTMAVPPSTTSVSPYPPAVAPPTTGYGGGGGSWSSGGGWTPSPDEFANELAPATPEVPTEEIAPAKAPMSTATKVVIGLGVAGALFSAFMKGA